MQEGAPQPEWDPATPHLHLHQHIVDTGMFDAMPQAEEFEPNEVVVARHNGDIYHVQELDGAFVRIWYKTEAKEADEIVPRDDVRPANSYAQISYEIAEPGVKITVDKQGHAIIERPLPRRAPGTPPPYPGPMN